MNRKSEIVEIDEIESEELDPRELILDELFDNFKIALVDEQRLLKRFYDFCVEYNNFEYDEMGLNMDDSEMVLNKVNKIRDKLLINLEEKLSLTFQNIKTDVLINLISLDLQAEDFQYKIKIEVFEDSFNLEIK